MKLKYFLLKFAVAILLTFIANVANAQLASVKTNALLWGNLTPNLSLELVTAQKISVEGTAFYSFDKTPLKTNLAGVQLEGRYWLSGRPMNRLFVGLSLTGLKYKTTLGSYAHNGDAAGTGIVYGYALPIGNRWNLEFSTGIGLIWYREKRYIKEENIDSKPYNEHGFRMMPTKLAVSFAYLF